jgi:hypothetical protein
MFESEDLKNHIESSSTVKSKAFIVAEWNLNDPENVQQLGNYRHRWTYANSYYKSLNSQWDISDNGSNATHRWWKDATNCDDSIEGAYDNDDEPTIFIEEDVRIASSLIGQEVALTILCILIINILMGFHLLNAQDIMLLIRTTILNTGLLIGK